MMAREEVDISERSDQILKAVVCDYIKYGGTVSSKTIAQKYSTNISSASVRSVMADLEARGFLRRPHTSAGRMPTPKAFKLYVEGIDRCKELPFELKQKIVKGCYGGSEVERVMKGTSRVLSAVSNCIGMVLAPRWNHVILEQIRLIKVGDGDTLVVLVSEIGTVQSRIVRTGEDHTRHDLERMSNYLNSIIKGTSLVQLRDKIRNEMIENKSLYDKMFSKARQLAEEILSMSEPDALYVDGRLNIFEQPEFKADMEKLKEILKAFEEKGLLVRLLDKSIDCEGVRVDIGLEDAVEGIEGCSLITASYGNAGSTLGTIGIMGSVRMNYPVVIPLVQYTAGILCDIFERRKIKFKDF